MKKLFSESLRKFRSIIFLFVVMALVGGSSTEAATVKPEQKVWESLFKLEDLSSLSFFGSVAYTGKSIGGFTDLLIDPVAMNKKNKPQYETVTVDFEGGTQIFTPTEEQSWFAFSTKPSDKKAPGFGMEVRSVGGKVYLAVTGARNVPKEADSYLNTWVQLDIRSLLKSFNLDSLVAGLADTDSVATPEKADLQKTRDLVAKSKIITIRGRYVQKVNDVLFDVYNFSLNKNNLQKFLATSRDISGQMFTTKQLSNINKEIADVKTLTGQIFISRKDGYPSKINLNIGGVQPKEKTLVQLTLKGFNQPVSVSEPAKFLTLEELFGQLFPATPKIDVTADPGSSLDW